MPMRKTRKNFVEPIPHGGKLVGRPTKWGNPFKIGRDGNRDDVINKYESWITSHPDVIEEAKSELKGLDLYCYCKQNESCHADILLRIANG